MAQEIYLYAPITQSVAEYFNRNLDWLEGRDVDIRMTTQGGFTSSGKAMLAGLKKYKGYKTMYVDGDVASMGAFMLMYADKVVMSSMAQIMFHKSGFAQNYKPTEAQIESVKKENIEFNKTMTQRLGEKGKELIDKIFKEDIRNDVWLTAQEAKDYGIVDEIINMDVDQKTAYEYKFHSEMSKLADKFKDKPNNNKMAEIEMTNAELEQKLREARESGIKIGSKAETERVASWNKYASIDPEAVRAGIESGEEISPSQREDLLLKAAMKSAKDNLKDENPGNTGGGNGDEGNETEEQKQAKIIAEREASAKRFKERFN